MLKSKKLSLIAVLALLGATLVAPPAWAATVDCSTGGSFTITDNVVTGHSTCAGAAEIPNSVTSIANFAFFDATALTSVTFEADSVLTSIGYDAFRQAALTSITIPNSVTSIGVYAFYDATALTSVTFEADSVLDFNRLLCVLKRDRTSVGNHPEQRDLNRRLCVQQCHRTSVGNL